MKYFSEEKASSHPCNDCRRIMDIRSFYCDFDDYCNEIINQCKGDSHERD